MLSFFTGLVTLPLKEVLSGAGIGDKPIARGVRLIWAGTLVTLSTQAVGSPINNLRRAIASRAVSSASLAKAWRARALSHSSSPGPLRC